MTKVSIQSLVVVIPEVIVLMLMLKLLNKLISKKFDFSPC